MTHERVSTDEERNPEVTDFAVVIDPFSDEEMQGSREWLTAVIERGRPSIKGESHRQIEHRLHPLRALSEKTGVDYAVDQLEFYESQAHPYTPSIGVEVEVYPRQLLTPSERKLPKTEREKLTKEREQAVDEVIEAGIPLDDSDPWTEFALEPARDWRTAMAELRALRDMKVVHLGEVYTPIHITLGGIKGDGEARLLSRALEVSGIATSPRRLMMPTERRKLNDFWKSGSSGIHDRATKDRSLIKGGVSDAVEFRTFMVLDEESVAETLESIQLLGAALSAWQDFKRVYAYKTPLGRERKVHSPVIAQGVTTETQAKLAAIWGEFSSRVEELFTDSGIKNPLEEWKEPDRGLVRATRGEFGKIADQLAGGGSELSQSVLTLIRQACKQIKLISDPSLKSRDRLAQA